MNPPIYAGYMTGFSGPVVNAHFQLSVTGLKPVYCDLGGRLSSDNE